MVYPNSSATFETMLLQFMSEEDPMLSMPKWLCEQLMEAEVTSKVNAEKSERANFDTNDLASSETDEP